jgi:hypothetical protein
MSSPILIRTTFKTHRTGGTDKLLRMPRGVEIGVAIPIGCTVPMAIAAAALVIASVLAQIVLLRRLERG